VPEVGSEEWVSGFAERASRVVVDETVRIVVQQELVDDGAWYIVVDGGRATVGGGRHPQPDVVLSQDRATAEAIAAGELSAQQAFIDGRLRVRGGLDRLVHASAALAVLGA
jgi:putative sterol carrier protein